jgi:hypothetical protein
MKKTAPILLNAILMIVGCPSIIQHVNQRSETPMALKDKSSLKPIRTIEGKSPAFQR